jgi:hypothetical protein
MYGLLKKSANTQTHEKIHWEEKFPTEPNICYHIVATLGATTMNVKELCISSNRYTKSPSVFLGLYLLIFMLERKTTLSYYTKLIPLR